MENIPTLSRRTLATLAGTALMSLAFAQPNFTNVASTREGYGINAGDRGAINSSGDLVFTALSGGVFQVFKSTGGNPAALVADSTGGFDSFGGVGINDSGQIAFGARLDNFGKTSVFGGPDPVADDLAPDQPTARYVGGIAADGTTLFTQEYRSGQSYYDILYKAKDGVSTEFARSRPNTPGSFRYLNADFASLASDGGVAVGGYTQSPGRIYGIFADGTATQAWVSTMDSAGGEAFVDFSNQGLASGGRLIFSARRNDRTGVFVTDGAGGFDLVAEEGALFGGFDAADGFTERLIIADDGRIAFEASLAAGGRAIYTGSNAATDRLIGTGDALFGSTVTGVAITPGSFASNGNLIVRYTLADGTQGFASANGYSTLTRAGLSVPQAVPEPATLAALGLGLAAMARRRRKAARR